jgi:hypothetical protein
VYAFLADLGFRTTKSVWAVTAPGVPHVGGATCDDPAYLAWTLQLQADGFEIGSHGASYTTTPRPLVARSLERFRDLYGAYPSAFANHTGCRESIYWGEERVSGLNRLAYNAMTRFRRRGYFRGSVPGDPLFWGDLCRQHVRYVRNFTFREVNTLRACPQMPYHDPERPMVNRWFASSEGAGVDAYNACLTEANQDRLEAEGGACIMYTHFASGFYRDGRLNPRFQDLMTRLAGRNGWFVPVTTLLDHIADQRGVPEITPGQRGALERRWLTSKIRVGYS